MQKQNMGVSAPITEADEYNIMYKGDYQGKAILVEDYVYIDMEVVNEEWALEMLFHAEDVNKIFYTTYTEKEEFSIGGEEFIEWNENTLFIRSRHLITGFTI